jgi:hypothetical protein
MATRIPGKAPWVVRLVAAALLAGACGCARTATVTGKVTYQGRPVTHGSVVFRSADKTARSGVIGPDGSYTVQGVHPGEVKVAVLSRDPSKARGKRTPEERAEAKKSWFPLPRKFEDPETSGVGYTVEAGTVRCDIDLK